MELTVGGQRTKQKQRDTSYLSIGVRNMCPSGNFEEPQSRIVGGRTWTLGLTGVY